MRIGNPLNALGAAISGGGVEERTSDYEANSTNAGKIWMRTDLSVATVKTIVKLSDNSYVVQSLTSPAVSFDFGGPVQ